MSQCLEICQPKCVIRELVCCVLQVQQDMEQGVHGAMQQVQRWEGSTCPRVLIMCAVVQICLGIDSSLQAAFAVPGGSVPGKARIMRLAEGLSNAPQAWEAECTRLYKQKCVSCILLCRS